MWIFLKPDDPNFVLERVVTVLVIACPHALGLAIPLVSQLSTAIGARNGILVRDRHALEDARRVDVVLFDKTGTLTTGQQGVVAIDATGEITEDDVLALAAAVEAKSEHPIARAIVARAKERQGQGAEGVQVPGARRAAARRATVDGRVVTVSSERVVDRARAPPRPVAGELGPGSGRSGRDRRLRDGRRAACSRLVAVADDGAAGVGRGRRRTRAPRRARGDAHRRLDTRSASGSRSNSASTRCIAEVLPAQKAGGRRESCRPAAPARRDGRRRRERCSRARAAPTSASRSVRARMWRSSRRASCSPRATRGRCRTC